MSFFAQQRKALSLLLLSACTILSTQQAAAQQADGSISSIERNADNTPAIIRFTPDAKWKTGQEQEIFKQYLGIDANTQMVQLYRTTTKMAVTTARYTQYYKGIKVQNGSYTLTEKDGLVHFISGNVYKAPVNGTTTPDITEAAAMSKAMEWMGAEKYMWQDPQAEANLKATYHKADTSYLPKGELVWVDNHSGGQGDRLLRLAYAFNVYAQKPLGRKMIYVDAHNGSILHSNSLIKHTAATGKTLYSGVVPFMTSRVGGTYVLYDSTRGGGIYTRNVNYNTSVTGVTEFASATNAWPNAAADTQALDAHWGAEKVYDYWMTQQGRNSYDGLGATLYSYVHLNDPSSGGAFDNAFWDGAEMCYGDGSGSAFGGFDPLTSLDVSGHEIGHAICEYTAGLVYEYESGAINEGLSDCWGATIENWANPLEVDAVAKSIWKIGEEIGAGTPLRSMSSPELYGNPGTYGGTDWTDQVGCTASDGNDQCGVHNNSGVTNKWYYLVVTGGIGVNTLGTAYSVNAIGFTDAANILYQTEMTLPTTCTYAQFRAASIAVATTLFGPCSAQTQSVTNAWFAVGVGTSFAPCTPQIGFTTPALTTTEYAATTACPASRTINIGLKPSGLPITGGNPLVNVVVGSGTAVAGVDYTLTGSSMTFLAGDTATHFATLTIYDNGTPNDDKTLVLGFTLSALGSTATISPLGDSMRITIANDDSAVTVGGPEYHILNIGTAATSNLTSAFPGNNRRSRTQYILTAAEMAAAGVRPGAPISQIGFYLTTKSSTAAFQNYAINMANTTATDVGSAFVTTGLVNVVTAGPRTTNLGLDTIAFTTNFTWDGTSNVMVQVCYGQNAAAFAANDQMSAIQGAADICVHVQSNTGTGTGCGLTWSGAGSNLSNARPVMRFKQIVPPTDIATVLGNTKTWTVNAGKKVIFYNPSDTNVIATVENGTANLGCVTAKVSAAGNGFTPAAFSTTANRSLKEITITPTINGATTTYDATIYLTNTELGAAVPSTLLLLKTNELTDATINSTNSVLLTPTLVTGTNYVGFKGTFTGFGRYILTDGPLCTPPTAAIATTGTTTFCLGSSVTLSATTGAGYTYQWLQGGVNIAGATSATYAATHGGNYTVLVSQASCSGTSAAVAVSVDSAYAAPISAAATSVCVGRQITLTDASGAGTWTSGNTALATVDASGNVYGVASGTTLISYTHTSLCGAATVTLSVTVNNNPTVAATTGTTGACVGAATVLTNTTPSGVWTSSNSGVAAVSAGTVSGVAFGSANISYTVTNGFGCTTSQITPVTIFALPSTTITPSGPTLFCSGSSVTLGAPTTAGYTYQWQIGGVNIAGATLSAYNSAVTGSYNVVVTNANNCTASSAVMNTTLDPGLTLVPSVTATATPGTTICSAATVVTYTATSVNGGSAPLYEWYVNGTGISTGATFSYTPTDGDQITAVLTSNAACISLATDTATLSMSISAYVHPVVAINAIPNDTICAGVMGTYAALPTFGGTTPAYIWKKNGVNVATGPAYNYVPSNGDILICTMTSNFPCRLLDTGVSAPLVITVNPNTVNAVAITADHTSAAPGAPITFTAASAGGGAAPAYQWYLNGGVIVGATSATYTVTTLVTGDMITCKVTSSELCATPATATSGGVTVLVTNGVDNVTGINSLMLMPNPNNGTFSIKGALAAGDINIKVANMLGQVVYNATATVQNNTVNETITLDHSLAAGVYIVNITAAGGNPVFHVVVNK